MESGTNVIMKKEERTLLNAEEVVLEFLKVVKQVQKNPKLKEIKYKGPEITNVTVRATSPSIQSDFSKKGLAYHRSKGRTPLEVVLWKLFQLGFQQGVNNEYNSKFHIMDLYESIVNRTLTKQKVDD